MRRGGATPRGPRAGRRARDARDLTAASQMGALKAELPQKEPQHQLPALVRLARPKQWIKNVLVIAAPGAAGVLGEPTRAVPHRDRVRVLLPRGERHLLPERRARRRSRSPAPDEAVPPGRGGRGLGPHRDHRRHRPRDRIDRAVVRGAVAALARRRRLPAADDPLQLVAEARGRARPRVRRVGLRAANDRGRCRRRCRDLALVPHRRGIGVAVHGHRASATRR